MAKAKKKKMTIEETLVPVEEQPYEVPENWCWVRIGSINYFESLSTDPRKQPDKTFELYSVPSSDNGYPEIILGKDIGSTKQKVQYNDVLLCKINPRINRVWRVLQYTNNDLIASSEWIVIRNEHIASKYLLYCFQTQYFRKLMLSNVSGVGGSLMRAKPKNVMTYPFPLPPLPEQQRIVEQIESLFSKLDEAKEKAELCIEGFSERKEAILYQAFRGELTKKWRSKHKVDSAQVYLQKLVDEGKTFSRKEFKFWKNKNLPEGWMESKIGNLLYFAGRIGWKGLKAEEYTEEGPLFLSVYNLNDGDEVTYNRVYHISKERYEESPEIMVRVGDVLLTKDGAGIGKLGYVKELPQEATINSSLLLIRPGETADYKYVFYLLSGPELQRIVKERITGSATPHLFQRDIKDFLIPVPPIEEQREIVSILDDIFAKEYQAYETANFLVGQIDLMKKSILAKAFRGELGTNHPEEESSVKLLEEILNNNINVSK